MEEVDICAFDLSSQGRALLVRILDAFVNKFSSLKKQIPKLVNKQTKGTNKSIDEVKGNARRKLERLIDLDCRLLMKTLVLGLKNIVWGISSCTPSFRPSQATPAQPVMFYS